MSTNDWEVYSRCHAGITYRSSDHQFLFIIPKDSSAIERVAQAWLDVNQEQPNIINEPELGQGIKVPNHDCHKHLFPNEIINYIIDVYQRSGRILFDKSTSIFCDTAGKIFTDNVFYALNLTQKHYEIDSTDKAIFETIINTKSFKKNSLDHIINTLKALCFIAKHRPDITNLFFLKNNLPSIMIISKAFNLQCPEDFSVALRELQTYCPENPELSIAKERCGEILGQYKIKKTQELRPHAPNTQDKIEALDHLIVNIQNSHFLEDINQLLLEFLRTHRDLLINPHHKGGSFRLVVKQCLELPQFADISMLYQLKETIIEALQEFQKSKKTLAWAKSFYSKSKEKIASVDELIDKIVDCNHVSELLVLINNFKVDNKSLFKKQTGDLYTCLDTCANLLQEHLENTHEHPIMPESLSKK